MTADKHAPVTDAHRAMANEFANDYGWFRDSEFAKSLAQLIANVEAGARPTVTQTDVEELSATLHDIYQQEARRQAEQLGRPVRHADSYHELQDSTKEYDRVLARFILQRDAAVRAAEKERCAGIADVYNGKSFCAADIAAAIREGE